MTGRFARWLAALLCLQLAFPSPFLRPAQAASSTEDIANTPGLSLGSDITPGGGVGSEYVSGAYPGAVLMPVNLWGAIAKPGLHHIPTRTDLVTLLTLAGGPGPDADLGGVTIKRRTGGSEQVIHVDGEDMLTKPGAPNPILEPNDIVIVPRDKPTIHPNTVAVLGFLTSIVTLVLTSVVFLNTVKK